MSHSLPASEQLIIDNSGRIFVSYELLGRYAGLCRKFHGPEVKILILPTLLFEMSGTLAPELLRHCAPNVERRLKALSPHIRYTEPNEAEYDFTQALRRKVIEHLALRGLSPRETAVAQAAMYCAMQCRGGGYALAHIQTPSDIDMEDARWQTTDYWLTGMLAAVSNNKRFVASIKEMRVDSADHAIIEAMLDKTNPFLQNSTAEKSRLLVITHDKGIHRRYQSMISSNEKALAADEVTLPKESIAITKSHQQALQEQVRVLGRKTLYDYLQENVSELKRRNPNIVNDRDYISFRQSYERSKMLNEHTVATERSLP